MCSCVVAFVVYLDHVKMTVVGENCVHLTVQLLEGGLDGVGHHCVVALIFVEEMVAWKMKESNGVDENICVIIRCQDNPH